MRLICFQAIPSATGLLDKVAPALDLRESCEGDMQLHRVWSPSHENLLA